MRTAQCRYHSAWIWFKRRWVLDKSYPLTIKVFSKYFEPVVNEKWRRRVPHKLPRRKIRVFCRAYFSLCLVVSRLIPWKRSNSQGTPVLRPGSPPQREKSGDVVNFTVEQEKEGFWTPVMVCQMEQRHIRKFLIWLHRECVAGQFDIPFDSVRVKRDRLGINPTWKFDGVAAWPV
jgi:hypothetical protein